MGSFACAMMRHWHTSAPCTHDACDVLRHEMGIMPPQSPSNQSALSCAHPSFICILCIMGSRKNSEPTIKSSGSYLQFGYTWTVALEKASRLTSFKYGECMKSARFVTRAYGQCYTWQVRAVYAHVRRMHAPSRLNCTRTASPKSTVGGCPFFLCCSAAVGLSCAATMCWDWSTDT